MTYSLALVVHSLLRWVTIVLAVVLCARSFSAMRADRPATKGDRGLSIAFVSSVDLQWLVGVVLYAFLSPVTSLFFHAPGASMKSSILRFYGLEHPALMMLALVVVHVARVRSKKREGAAYHRAVFVGTLIFLVLMVLGVPWPGRAAGRPLFRFSA